MWQSLIIKAGSITVLRDKILLRAPAGGRQAEELALGWFGSHPRVFLISSIWGRSKRALSLLAWALKRQRVEALLHF